MTVREVANAAEPGPDGRACGSCKWWGAPLDPDLAMAFEDAGGVGECFRYPPTVSGARPMTSGINWCGEHEERYPPTSAGDPARFAQALREHVRRGGPPPAEHEADATIHAHMHAQQFLDLPPLGGDRAEIQAHMVQHHGWRASDRGLTVAIDLARTVHHALHEQTTHTLDHRHGGVL